jgi:hypothetical protein
MSPNMKAAIVFLVAIFPVHAVVRNGVRATGGGRRLREPSKTDSNSIFKPMSFDQRLLICNAYPSGSSITVSKNEKAVTDSSHGIGFRECRYIASTVRPKDKLDLTLADLDIHGMFEVGELPTTDAVLLLVLEKRTGSALVSFKSFAFPSGSSTGSEAQLAVIDAFHGNSSVPHLKMEDHLESKGQRDVVSRRIEELAFNRVYAVEEGTYDASMPDQANQKNTRHTLKLARGQNYVLLRTGDDILRQPESLVVFPDVELRSLASPLARTSFATWCTAALAASIVALRLQ